jgi:RNA polymerase sigma factor (TIGR02999 family)
MQPMLADCYGEMRRIARGLLAGDALKAVYQPTELANEAVLRLLDATAIEVSGRGHLLACAARTMRRTLIDESRKQAAAKRRRPELVTSIPGGGGGDLIPLERLDEALAALARHSPEHAEIVELRFSLGMTVEEAAAATGLAERTLKRRWQAARTWLQDYLDHGPKRD